MSEFVERMRKALRTAGFVDLDDDTVPFWPHGDEDWEHGPTWRPSRTLCEVIEANLPRDVAAEREAS